MKNFLLLITVLFNCTFVEANDRKKEVIDLLAQKTIEDFHKAIEIYNQKKEVSAPVIKNVGKHNYHLVINRAKVQFTLVNYINDQIYVNDQLVKRSTFGLSKTTFNRWWISNATAADVTSLDAVTTKIILTALGSLQNNLEEIGMLCFSDCQKTTRETNLRKIMSTLNVQSQTCSEQLYNQNDSIKKYPSFKMVSLLHSTLNSEFQSVRDFYQKVSETNQKSVNDFMATKLGITKISHDNCVGVMVAGTVADGSMDNFSKGISVLKTRGPVGTAIESAIEEAQNVCLKMEELKNCLVDLNKGVNTINSIKRKVKESTGIDYAPEERLPDIKNISR